MLIVHIDKICGSYGIDFFYGMGCFSPPPPPTQLMSKKAQKSKKIQHQAFNIIDSWVSELGVSKQLQKNISTFKCHLMCFTFIGL